ncbi:MAG TPA: DNA-formamidopyrimidine glycosylase [Cyanobacteria bacterium UBA8156]|nr:DNA-formamidopyrimidine glycosylase [Cyanobacteria bacterium UBA8156]
MPELPEVETVCRGLVEATLGWTIAESRLLWPGVVSAPSAEEFQRAIAGQKLLAWHRRGKYLLGECESGGWVGIHLRMTGALRWEPGDPQPDRHERLRLRLVRPGREDFCLRFIDQRTFGRWWWVYHPEQEINGLRQMGPEPLQDGFTPAVLAKALQKRTAPLKSTLLNQRVVAGLGNIYVDESLFVARLHPQRRAHSLTGQETIALSGAIRQVLRDGLQHGGTTFSHFANLGGQQGNYLQAAWVFRRTGLPCRVCQTPIARIRLGGRSTHFCPCCQPSPA